MESRFSTRIKLANGNTISEPKKNANAFNDFFIGIGDGGVSNAAPTMISIDICQVRLIAL